MAEKKWTGKTRTSSASRWTLADKDLQDGSTVVASIAQTRGNFTVQLLHEKGTLRHGKLHTLNVCDSVDAKRVAETLLAERRFDGQPEQCPACKRIDISSTGTGWKCQGCGHQWADVLKVTQ